MKNEKKLSTIKDRILKIAEAKGINKAKFVEGLEQKYANYRGSAKKSAPSAEVVAKILLNYDDINIDWVLVGMGDMFQKEKEILPTVITVDTQGNENIVFVPFKASAGYLNGYADPEYMHQLPAYRMPGISNGVFRMFEISGQSMKETLVDGDKIVGEWMLPEDIKDGQVYIIVSKYDGICVKRCINLLKSDNKLILQSDNKDFDNIVINAEDILEVWSAKLRLTRKFDNSSLTLNHFAEKAEDILETWSAKQRNISKFNDLSKALERIAELETRLASHLAFIEKNLLNKP